MNPGPYLWGLIGVIAVLSLRAIFTRVERGDPILPSFTSPTTSRDEEEAVIVTITLSSGGFGDKQERQQILELEHQLSEAIERSSTGEFEGDEFGGGTCTIYMYGRSAEELFTITWPILEAFRAPAGSYIIKRNSDGREQRMPIASQ
jgi:hypothetical protein